MLSHFECITHSSLISLEEIKLITISNWIFHNFLRLFIFLKYGLILLRYFLTDNV